MAGNSEITSLTSFANEACDQVAIRGEHSAMPAEFYTDDKNVTDIKEYFTRPKLIDKYVYDNVTRGVMGIVPVTNIALQQSLSNFNRVRGAFGWRGTVCYRIQSISNPFQAGRVKLAFQPLILDAITTIRTDALTPVSQLPGVEMDICETTSAVLKIPFIFPNNYFTVESSGESLGRLALFAMMPATLGVGATAPSITLWQWIEDFELIGATAPSVVPQAGKFKKLPSVAEEAEIPGNLSNVLSAGSKLMSWIGPRVPLISAFSGPTSWMLREAGKIAASYGWAKPLAVTPPGKMINTYNTYQFNSDGPDSSYNLAAFSDNAVSPYVGFAGTDVDEMAIDYIKSVSTAFGIGTVSATDAPSDYLFTCQCCPEALFFNPNSRHTSTINNALGAAYWPTSVSGLSNCFELYRGGLKFKIKIAKTKFHTGRLIVGFIPRPPQITPDIRVPEDPADMQFKSIIWDLREGNELEFDCPFICPLTYLDVRELYGTFFIAVLDPLAGPDTVSQSVPFIVEVCGMPDLEFAKPKSLQRVLAPTNTQFVFQAGNFEPTNTSPNGVAEFAIGEKLNSIKQLISRANLVNTFTSGQHSISLRPSRARFTPGPSMPTGLADVDRTYINYFQGFYALARGGHHVDVVPVGNDMCITAHLIDDKGIENQPLISEGRTALHVKVPYYNNRTRHTVGGNNGGENIQFVRVLLSGTPQTTVGVVYRRAAEDYQLGYYVGAPPLVNEYVVSPTSQVATSVLSTLRS